MSCSFDNKKCKTTDSVNLNLRLDRVEATVSAGATDFEVMASSTATSSLAREKSPLRRLGEDSCWISRALKKIPSCHNSIHIVIYRELIDHIDTLDGKEGGQQVTAQFQTASKSWSQVYVSRRYGHSPYIPYTVLHAWKTRLGRLKHLFKAALKVGNSHCSGGILSANISQTRPEPGTAMTDCRSSQTPMAPPPLA